jgi:hypothetical protein
MERSFFEKEQNFTPACPSLTSLSKRSYDDCIRRKLKNNNPVIFKMAGFFVCALKYFMLECEHLKERMLKMPSGGANKFTYEFVKDFFLQQGCDLLEDEYVSNGTKMKYRCSCGGKSEVRFRDFKRGRRCQDCKGRTNSKKLRTSEDDITKLCEEYKCQFVRSWIQSKRIRIEFICKCGRNWEAYLSNYRRCPNCKKCGNKKVSGPNCYMYDPDRDAVAMRKRFRKVCGQHIRRFMRATGQKKTRSTHELLGYRPQDLQEHILNHPDYKSCNGDWHVDHIFPIQAFLDHDILDLSVINHLSNLRPMPGPENLSKADKYDEQDFKKWLRKRQQNNL